MLNPDDTQWHTDHELFAALPGGRMVIDWFGFVRSFHDATLDWLEVANGSVSMMLKTFRMTDAVNADGYFVLDKHALVTIDLSDVTGLWLNGDACSIIFELGIRRVEIAPQDFTTCAGPSAGDIEVSFETSYGLAGSIYAREVSLSLKPA